MEAVERLRAEYRRSTGEVKSRCTLVQTADLGTLLSLINSTPTEAQIAAGVEVYRRVPSGEVRSVAELCRQIYTAMLSLLHGEGAK